MMAFLDWEGCGKSRHRTESMQRETRKKIESLRTPNSTSLRPDLTSSSLDDLDLGLPEPPNALTVTRS
ncbi:hypothetical protein EUGRSUZ_H00813 [Eucalyptus grandis]|uniref:Uncharacterized protein n=2 Tax=Eucalyptus grandis TaxID=71139 RepID=A0ACC3JMG1_EUCGR|nr:hypothetical protein EUGRSUZ_H00813 [Eucalyptus grandis]